MLIVVEYRYLVWKDANTSKVNDDKIYNVTSYKIGKMATKKKSFFSATEQNQKCPNKTKTITADFTTCC